MNVKLLFGIALSYLSLPLAVNAAQVDVVWQQPEKYQDVYAGEGHQKKFEQTTFEQLAQHFKKLAEKLPAEQTLKITVTDLDLAGDVHLGGMTRIRIVKDMYYPRIAMSYQLLSADQSVLQSADVNLKDINFLTHSSLKYQQKSLSYEKKMLDEWFEQTFLKS